MLAVIIAKSITLLKKSQIKVLMLVKMVIIVLPKMGDVILSKVIIRSIV